MVLWQIGDEKATEGSSPKESPFLKVLFVRASSAASLDLVYRFALFIHYFCREKVEQWRLSVNTS
jgi:hypothetical protein